jgi:ubiquinone/menaquinone biosynthesis C-methylase UbiE
MSSNFSGEDNFKYQGDDLNATIFANNYHNWVVKKFQNYVGKVILEVGAGKGNFTKHLSKKFPNSKIISLEPSVELFMELEKNTKDLENVTIFNDFSISIVEDLKKFNIDTVIYNNVLEHVQNDIQELKEVREIMLDGGHIITYSPAMKYLYSKFDKSIGHYRRYSKKEINEKMNINNFKVVENYYCEFVGSLLWFLKFKIIKSANLEESNVKFYDKIIFPIISFFEPRKGVIFGKNILTIGLKI